VPTPAPVKIAISEKAVSPFTGKVKGKKVRLRLKADMDSHVIRELEKNELVTVVGEKGDFWAVQAPTGIKAYVFRSFILDNVVEGNRVNVRLEPNTEAPVISHLNMGDKVQGVVCSANNKWLEIAAPERTHFYVAKEYLEKVGGPEIKLQAEKRRVNAEQLLEAANLLSKTELRKSLDEMDIDRVSHSYKTIISDYVDFPEYVEKAKELLASTQEAYVQKRLEMGESKGTSHALNRNVQKQDAPQDASLHQISDRMKMWEPMEEAMFLSWAHLNEEKTLEQFYEEQKLAAVPITGIVEAYTSPVKNKPGDFIIRDKDLPVAYVYSTKINLQSLVGKRVTLLGSPRASNNFAFPAFFVLSVE
ncbi:MAG: SH3 domain-containing protein, partial [Chlamydiales bacterium]